jgi:hypothetical protein
MPDSLIRLCGLWFNRSGRSGAEYLSGKLNRGTRLVAFKNTRKAGSSEPDYHLFIRADEPREESQ